MISTETTWQVDVDYKALGCAGSPKARMAKGRGARSAIKAAGYRSCFTCRDRASGEAIAREIYGATGVPMRVDEVVAII